jgi:hypothetical protein
MKRNFLLICLFLISLINLSSSQEPELNIEHGWLKEDLIKDEFTMPSKSISENFEVSEEKWLASNNLLTYFELSPIKKLSIPLYINLIFLGK